MNPQNKNIALSIVAVLIIGTIIYIEWNKPAMLAPGSAQNIALTADDVSNATSTATTTGAVGEFGDAAPSAVNMDRIKAKAGKYPSAVEIIPGPESGATGAAATGFINSDPFTLKSLVGNKVVLLDFWTYSCIN